MGVRTEKEKNRRVKYEVRGLAERKKWRAVRRRREEK